MSNRTKTETAFQAIDRIVQSRDAHDKPIGEGGKEPYAHAVVRCCKKTVDPFTALKLDHLRGDPEGEKSLTRLLRHCKSFDDISKKRAEEIERLRFENRLTIREIARKLHKSGGYVSAVLDHFCLHGNRRLSRKGRKKAA